VCEAEPKKEFLPEFEYEDLLQVQKSENAKNAAVANPVKALRAE
jgi:hypothetical protein